MRASGIDWHIRYQSEYSGDHDFVILKISEGTYSKNIDKALSMMNHINVRGGYHYFRSGIDWKAQADTYLENSGGVHFHALDFERYNNKPSMRFGHDAKKWLDYVKEETKQKVILYSSPSVIQEYLLMYGNHWSKTFPLWIAQYPFYRWNDRLNNILSDPDWQPRLPAGHKTWLFWQYTDKENGKLHGVKSRTVDRNVFNGTVEDLHKWAGVSDTPSDELPKTYQDAVNEMQNQLDEMR